jgi:hypothetical protein
MPRAPFSVRLPADLAESLDRIAAYCQKSRSDLVEMLITAVDENAECRDEVVKTVVDASPTERRNLRLSAEVLARLKRLCGDLEPADFLRRMVAYVVAMAPAEWRQGSATDANGHTSASSRAARSADEAPTDAAEDDDVEIAAVRASAAGLAVLALILVCALVTLILWLIWRDNDPPTFGSPDIRGQLPPDPTQKGTA